MTLEEEIKDQLSKEIALAIDQEIIDNIMIASITKDGWTGTNINPAFDRVSYPEMTDWYGQTAEWIHINATGDYQLLRGQWYFEKPEDATMFILRWS